MKFQLRSEWQEAKQVRSGVRTFQTQEQGGQRPWRRCKPGIWRRKEASIAGMEEHGVRCK